MGAEKQSQIVTMDPACIVEQPAHHNGEVAARKSQLSVMHVGSGTLGWVLSTLPRCVLPANFEH
jgi:hypothetical protein